MTKRRVVRRCRNCGKLVPEKKAVCDCELAADTGPMRVEERCECKNLLARHTPETIEIKCRKCKRIVRIPTAELKQRFKEKLESDSRGQGQKHG